MPGRNAFKSRAGRPWAAGPQDFSGRQMYLQQSCAHPPPIGQRHQMGVEFRPSLLRGARSGADSCRGVSEEASGQARPRHPSGPGLPAGSSSSATPALRQPQGPAAPRHNRAARPLRSAHGPPGRKPRPPGRAAAPPARQQPDRGDRPPCQFRRLLQGGGQSAPRGKDPRFPLARSRGLERI